MKGEPLSALRRIRTRDNGESLVDLHVFCPWIVIDTASLGKRRLTTERSVHARKTVVQMIRRARKTLPKGVTFKIRDAWRPIHVQRQYYSKALARMKKAHPKWNRPRLRRELNIWIFPPDVGIPPWHSTGGAIDLTLCRSDGQSLPLGGKTRPTPPRIARNRALLKRVMERAGFTNYAAEWWHFSYGDTGWALRTGRKTAIYGTANLS
ncbi:MAG: D-alanyl-D-alanine dipeptidase [Parcubacteria group bacterium Gr01-1014_106]|nr:MAG: D-alanyl-D-alanine dipeptidase [Parcubacteria group bacterium Gr01-1014_106]